MCSCLVSLESLHLVYVWCVSVCVCSCLVSLEALHLASNNIEDAGCTSLARALSAGGGRSSGGGGEGGGGGGRGRGARGGGGGGGGETGRVCSKLRHIDLERNHHITDEGRSVLKGGASLGSPGHGVLPNIEVTFSFQFLFG